MIEGDAVIIVMLTGSLYSPQQVDRRLLQCKRSVQLNAWPCYLYSGDGYTPVTSHTLRSSSFIITIHFKKGPISHTYLRKGGCQNLNIGSTQNVPFSEVTSYILKPTPFLKTSAQIFVPLSFPQLDDRGNDCSLTNVPSFTVTISAKGMFIFIAKGGQVKKIRGKRGGGVYERFQRY